MNFVSAVSLIGVQLGRSVLCRLTWLLRPGGGRSLPGDSPNQEECRWRSVVSNRHHRCLFSELLNEAHGTIEELINALDDESAADVGDLSKGLEMGLIMRSLKLIEDLLLFGTRYAPAIRMAVRREFSTKRGKWQLVLRFR